MIEVSETIQHLGRRRVSAAGSYETAIGVRHAGSEIGQSPSGVSESSDNIGSNIVHDRLVLLEKHDARPKERVTKNPAVDLFSIVHHFR